MTGGDVVWNDGMREIQGQKMHNIRVTESQEQKRLRIFRRSETIAANPEKWKERNEKISRTRREKKEFMSEIARKAYINKSVEAKKASARSIIEARMRTYKLIDGSYQKFQSSWEAACANILLQVGQEYKTQVPFSLGGKLYHADFVFGNTIIEVKGHPKAWDLWKQKTKPAILSHLKVGWFVYLLPFKSKLGSFPTLEAFLKSMTRVI